MQEAKLNVEPLENYLNLFIEDENLDLRKALTYIEKHFSKEKGTLFLRKYIQKHPQNMNQLKSMNISQKEILNLLKITKEKGLEHKMYGFA